MFQITPQHMQARMMRGYGIIAKGDEPKVLDDEVFKVPSQSGNGKYVITREGETWTCTCPDHVYRKVDCKHINAVKISLALKEKMDKETIIEAPKIVSEIEKCSCGSIRIVKWGNRKTMQGKVQLFKCQDCGKRFSKNEGFKYMKHDPKIITMCLDLYFKGVSQRGIAEHLSQFYDIKVSHVAVLGWIKRFSKLIDGFVSDLTPELSQRWHIDEMKIKCKGEWSWLWNVMDGGSRFMLSSLISKGEIRDIKTARKPLKEAKKIAKGQKPEVVVTDGLKAYYNFIRPHQSLNGKTPSEIAEIGMNLGRNKWYGLIKASAGKKM